MSRAEMWDQVDGYLARIQLGEFTLISHVRADLAVLRHLQGESEPTVQLQAENRKVTEAGFSSRSPLSVTAEVADPRNSGYAGEFCADCGSPNMVRTGTCLTCQNCGSTSGCS